MVLPTKVNSSQVAKSNLVIWRVAKRYSQLKSTPNSSQLEPSYVSNHNLHLRVVKQYQVEPACKKPFNCLNATMWLLNDNKTTWRELSWVGTGSQMVEKLAPVGQKFQLDQI